MHTLDHAHRLAGFPKSERKTVTRCEAQKPATGAVFADHPAANLARFAGQNSPVRPALGEGFDNLGAHRQACMHACLTLCMQAMNVWPTRHCMQAALAACMLIAKTHASSLACQRALQSVGMHAKRQACVHFRMRTCVQLNVQAALHACMRYSASPESLVSDMADSGARPIEARNIEMPLMVMSWMVMLWV